MSPKWRFGAGVLVEQEALKQQLEEYVIRPLLSAALPLQVSNTSMQRNHASATVLASLIILQSPTYGMCTHMS